MNFCLILLLFVTDLSFAGDKKDQAKPHLSVEAMEAIAQNSIISATALLNDELAGKHEGKYPKRMLKELKELGKQSVSSEYLMDKCIYKKKNILSMMSSEFTAEDDGVATKNHSLSSMKEMYKRKIAKLIELACVNAQERFEARLNTLTVNGNELCLDSVSVKELSFVMFFPTQVGKASFKKKFTKTFTLLLSTAVVLGTAGAALGIPLSAVILTATVPVSSVWSYTTQLVGHPSTHARLTELITTGDYLKLDLTSEETILVDKICAE